MTSALRANHRVLAVALGACFLALAFLGQLAGETVFPSAERTTTTRVVARAGWSYLGGLRTFAAAVMWNRIEPIFHSYYRDVPLDEQRYMLPWIALVTSLDPSLLDPWYVGSWIVARNGKVEEGVALARKGMEANPRSGLLAASYAQMLYLFHHDAKGALSYAEMALGPEMSWRSLEEQFEAYAFVRDILRANGLEAEARDVEARMREIGARIEAGEDAANEHHHDGE
ncbi:MAG: hypothetical protein QMD76_08425 [Anaerosomatales bacterium]|nr:hypothetical protein [Anaerosomatales bacterium]GAV31523.1 hypothetical protein emb_1c0243 [Coriobacteriaceae bacterium EMTCatB1]